jgi:hypothetical protein
VTALQKLYDALPEPFCDCCQLGNHTSPCACGGVHACCHPQRHLRGNKTDRHAMPELVGIAETAGILEVSRQRAVELAQRVDFPRPVARLRCGAVYLAWEIEDYHANRRRHPGRPRKVEAA